jgi:hypothetical protein
MRLIEKLFIQGVTLSIILIILKAWLDSAEHPFMSYMPPFGFAFFMAITYFAQPIAIGVLNIALTNSLHQTKGWQVGFWLNGFFLLLAFLTINLILQTTFTLQFLPTIAVIDLLLSLPFGCIARFSNGGWKKPIK